MPVYIEGQSVSFSQNSSLDCSYVSSTWFRHPGFFGRAVNLTLTIGDGLDSFTTKFPFVVERGISTDVVFGSDWFHRRDVVHHHNVSLPLSEIGDGA